MQDARRLSQERENGTGLDMTARETTRDVLDWECLATGTVAAKARHRVELRLTAWRLAHLAEDIKLVAAELITNACTARPDGVIKVRMIRERHAVLLAVWDSVDEMPKVQPTRELELDDLDLTEGNLDRNGGWGLQLVRSLASECGARTTEPRGKWVWARFMTSEHALSTGHGAPSGPGNAAPQP